MQVHRFIEELEVVSSFDLCVVHGRISVLQEGVDVAPSLGYIAMPKLPVMFSS